jgi:hypothetical protein
MAASRRKNDETKDESSSAPITQGTDQTLSADPLPEGPHHDETDVQAAIDVETEDGKGEAEVPPSDFRGYATDEVEKPRASVNEIASRVLSGEFGNYDVMRKRLDEAGYNVKAVLSKVNERLANGAPSAYKPTLSHLAEGVVRGEWGDEKSQRIRLQAAGFNALDVQSTVRRWNNR